MEPPPFGRGSDVSVRWRSARSASRLAPGAQHRDTPFTIVRLDCARAGHWLLLGEGVLWRDLAAHAVGRVVESRALCLAGDKHKELHDPVFDAHRCRKTCFDAKS